MLAALLAQAAPGVAPPGPGSKAQTARPVSKREPSDDPAITSLAAALLPPLPTPPPPAGAAADDSTATGAGATGGQPPSVPADVGCSPAPGAPADGAALVPELAIPQNAGPENAMPQNSASENAPLAPAGQDFPGGQKPELAFAVRLNQSGQPDIPQPAPPGLAPSNAAPSNAPASNAAPSPADPSANRPSAASQTKIAQPDPQPSGSNQGQDPGAPASAPDQRSGTSLVQAVHPVQGTSTAQREPRRAADIAAASPEGATAAPTTALAPASSGAPALGARDRAPEVAAPPAAAPPEAPRKQPKESAVRELSLALPGPSANGREQVSLRVVERSGEVQVAVRTADPQLADALRQNLPDLVSDLAGRGYRTETWQPLAASGADAGALPRAGATAADSSAGQSFSGQSGDGSRNGGSPAGQQQQQQRQGQDPSQPSWLQALTRSAAKTGSTPYDDYTH